MPKMSIRHSTTSMIAAACPGAITSARSGVAVAPAPPRPPFERPDRTTAGTAAAQNHGSATRSSLVVDRDVSPLDEVGVFLELLGHHRLEVLHRHRQRVAAELADLRAHVRRLDE